MFDEAIHVSLDDLRERMRSVHPTCIEMAEEIERLVRSGGKRIRPTFCYTAFRGLGGEHCSEIILAASSLEMLHTFALIHDDIMDRSAMRRGRASTYSTRPTDALLIGDLAFALSDTMFWRSGFAPEHLVNASRVLTEMRDDAIAGQFLDLRSFEDAEMLRTIARAKTASYTITGPLLLGASLAGESSAELNLRGYGDQLGEAFQLIDDYQGVFAETDEAFDASVIWAWAKEMATQEQISVLTESRSSNPARTKETLVAAGVVERLHTEVGSLVIAAKSEIAVEAMPSLHEDARIVLNHLADSISAVR